MRLCSGHPKVHFGTIVEGSWGGGGGCTVGPPGSLTIKDCDRKSELLDPSLLSSARWLTEHVMDALDNSQLLV